MAKWREDFKVRELDRDHSVAGSTIAVQNYRGLTVEQAIKQGILLGDLSVVSRATTGTLVIFACDRGPCPLRAVKS